MIGFTFCERCGVPIAVFGPSACERCLSAVALRAKRARLKKKAAPR